MRSSFKEEWRSLFSNKMLLIILFVMPLLTIILIGFEFDQEVITDIPMAVIDEDQSTFSRMLVDSFDQNETFKVSHFPDNTLEMETLVRNSKARVGMIIPKGFYDDVTNLKSPDVMMIYDGSHMSITSMSKTKAMEILLTYKAGATIKQLTSRLSLTSEEAFNITQAFQFKNRVLYNPSKSFKDFLSPILLAGCIQSAIVLTASVSVDHSIYFRNRWERLGYTAGKTLFYTLMGSVSFMLCILLQITLLKMTFRGNLLNALILSVGLSFAVSSFCVLISSLMKNRMIALIAGAVVFIPNSIMAGTTWPLLSMPIGYQSFAQYMPFAHYVINIRDIYLKGYSLHHLGGDVIYLFAFGAIVISITEMVTLIAAKEVESGEFNEDGILGSLEDRISCDIQI